MGAYEEYEQAAARASGAYKTETGETRQVSASSADRFIRAARDMGATVTNWSLLPRNGFDVIGVWWCRPGPDAERTMRAGIVVRIVDIEMGLLGPEQRAEEIVRDLQKRCNATARERQVL